MRKTADILIEPADPGDFDRIWEIELCSFDEPWSRESLREELDNPYCAGFAAWEGTEIVGYVLLRRVFDEWTIMNIAVYPARRRKGVASALLRFVERTAHEVGITRLTLEVHEKNDHAKRLYATHGYQAVGYRPGYYDQGRSGAVIMDRYLGDD